MDAAARSPRWPGSAVGTLFRAMLAPLEVLELNELSDGLDDTLDEMLMRIADVYDTEVEAVDLRGAGSCA